MADTGGGSGIGDHYWALEMLYAPGNSCPSYSLNQLNDRTTLAAWTPGGTFNNGGMQAPYCGAYKPDASHACTKPVIWCPIPSMDHRLWGQAAQVTWTFFSQQP
jgi:hypothetical protein